MKPPINKGNSPSIQQLLYGNQKVIKNSNSSVKSGLLRRNSETKTNDNSKAHWISLNADLDLSEEEWVNI